MTNWDKKHPEGNSHSGRNYRKKRSNSTKGSNAGKPARFRVACNQCPAVAGEPVYVYVNAKARKAICPKGHITECTGNSV